MSAKEATAREAMPWSDCKVAFGIDEPEPIWDAFSNADCSPRDLPPGWSLCETDGTGARYVAVFRVEGDLRKEDGATVAASIKKVETRARRRERRRKVR